MTHRWLLLLTLALTPISAISQTTQDPALEVQTYVSGLSTPVTMAFIGDDDLLVLQQFDGQVRRVTGGVLQPAPVLDLAVDISLSDRGLLGIALDPEFPVNRFVYLYYTEADVDGGTPLGTRVYRYTWNGSNLVSPQLVLELPLKDGKFRVGGILRFGPDDRLYTVIGDLQSFGKLQNLPMRDDPDDTSTIFRTTRDGKPLPDNPFYGLTGPLEPMNRYYAYGLRNSFGLAFDPWTGALWDTENGMGVYDEVNRVDPGFNSGWQRLQGPLERNTNGVEDLWTAPGAEYSDPEFSWLIPIAPTAIAFVATPKLGCGRAGRALVASTNCGDLYELALNAARDGVELTSPELLDLVADNESEPCTEELGEILFASGFDIPTDIVVGPDGLVYVIDLTVGTIQRIQPAADPVGDADGDGVQEACDCDPAQPGAYALPAELSKLRVGTDGWLSWDDPRPMAGSATTVTIVTGLIADLRVDGGFNGSCTLAAGVPGRSYQDTRQSPPVAEGFYYLARAENVCGTGSYGDGSAPMDPRDGLDLASRPPCP